MQYNKQLFTADLLDLRLHLSTCLARKFAHISCFPSLGASLIVVFPCFSKAVVEK